MTVQDALRELRRVMGLTQEQFARHIEVTTRTVSKYETDGTAKGPFLKKLWTTAEEQGAYEIASEFRRAYLDDMEETAGMRGTFIAEGPIRNHLLDLISDARQSMAENVHSKEDAGEALRKIAQKWGSVISIDEKTFRTIADHLANLEQTIIPYSLAREFTPEDSIGGFESAKQDFDALGELVNRFYASGLVRRGKWKE